MTVSPLLIDTNIIIDHLRGKNGATRFLLSLNEQPCISSLTVAELFAGVKGKQEKTEIHKLLTAFQVLSVTKEIAERGGILKNIYHKSHNVGLADALIGATTLDSGRILVTLNKKHFPMLKDIIVPY